MRTVAHDNMIHPVGGSSSSRRKGGRILQRRRGLGICFKERCLCGGCSVFTAGVWRFFQNLRTFITSSLVLEGRWIKHVWVVSSAPVRANTDWLNVLIIIILPIIGSLVWVPPFYWESDQVAATGQSSMKTSNSNKVMYKHAASICDPHHFWSPAAVTSWRGSDNGSIIIFIIIFIRKMFYDWWPQSRGANKRGAAVRFW